ncbi:hypothetical protein CLOACE_22410 [Clostridium acetireducens DSM 10703]|uniref:Transglutaminase-like superfamily protein n=1 Tax=Clostridium acetireducens DSM 10703 TaxID=1121290 RepID=A0A1E8EVA1_9CLOT|nr:transglutaminase-like domain-containing protein [Clostridium acetireducens]OFH99451.1 hypothetical protein CLOACE_22410 [Clostridium acetireducens DSM 10703]
MKNKKYLIFIICFFITILGFSACKSSKNTKGIFVIKWNNIYSGNNIQFHYEDPENISIKEINNKYKLSKEVSGYKDDFDKALKLMYWIHNNYKFKKNIVTDYYDTLSILEKTKKGDYLSDKDLSIVYSQAASSLNLYVRRGEFKVKDIQNNLDDYYFKVCEVWSNKYNKWILMDVANGCYMELNGEPLSAMEVLNKGIENVKVNAFKENKKYSDKIKKYIYSYTIEIDNNIYAATKSNSYITYINEKEIPEIALKDYVVPSTIFVNKPDLFTISPETDYKNAKPDDIPTLIFLKKKSEKQEDTITLNGGAFKDSGMVSNYYISIDNNPWQKTNLYFSVTLKKENTNIRLSLDGKKVLREVTLVYKN